MYAVEEANEKLKLTVTKIPEEFQNKASNRNKHPKEYSSQPTPDASNQKRSKAKKTFSSFLTKKKHENIICIFYHS